MHNERLHVPLRWWVQTVMLMVALWYVFLVALGPVVAWGLTIACGLAIGGSLFAYGSVRVRVVDGVLHAGRATIGLHQLRDPEPLDTEATRLAMGRDADVRAFLLTRPWVRHSVRVWVDDPADPTPYWLVSTRHPRRLATALADTTTVGEAG